jgi:hypothetical protein
LTSHALRAGKTKIMADGALDAWALGVVAFELLTRTQAFQIIIDGKDAVRLTRTGNPCTHNLVCSFCSLLCMHAFNPLEIK